MQKAVFGYSITPKGEQKYNKSKHDPGSMTWHFFYTTRALWILHRMGKRGGTAEYLRHWMGPLSIGTAESTLNKLVSKGLAKRRKLSCL